LLESHRAGEFVLQDTDEIIAVWTSCRLNPDYASDVRKSVAAVAKTARFT
jgi:hypothetical protein